MPSPFPGMDPFLEHPTLFPGVHDRLIAYLSEALQATLPAPYFAEINERHWVDTSERTLGPDVDLLRGSQPTPASAREGGAVAVAPEVAQPILITVPLEEHRQTYLEIRSPLEAGERGVATVEVLSPSNKAQGPRARDLYLQKQREVLDSDTHLVEIDLLRGGAHTTAVPLDRLRRKAPPFDYHVCVHAFDRPGTFAVYTVALPSRLPAVALPLLPGDGPVTIDLQAVFDRCYDSGPYRRRVRYHTAQLVPPLRDDQLAWASGVLRSKGLLPESPAPPGPA